MRRITSTLLLALVPSLFCGLMTTPILFLVPLSCPEGSKVIGIECFDSRGNNFTPWYRRDLNPSFVSFPLWLVATLVLVWGVTKAPIKSQDVEAIRALLAQGKRDEALKKVQAITKLEPNQAEAFVANLQNAPPGKDPLDYAWAAAQQAAEPELEAASPAERVDPDADKRWLPTQCPHCGGALAITDVQWISSFEARCPFCGSVLKA
jgi:hypothetical protein